jgi:hypothetical protein
LYTSALSSLSPSSALHSIFNTSKIRKIKQENDFIEHVRIELKELMRLKNLHAGYLDDNDASLSVMRLKKSEYFGENDVSLSIEPFPAFYENEYCINGHVVNLHFSGQNNKYRL